MSEVPVNYVRTVELAGYKYHLFEVNTGTISLKYYPEVTMKPDGIETDRFSISETEDKDDYLFRLCNQYGAESIMDGKDSAIRVSKENLVDKLPDRVKPLLKKLDMTTGGQRGLFG